MCFAPLYMEKENNQLLLSSPSAPVRFHFVKYFHNIENYENRPETP